MRYLLSILCLHVTCLMHAQLASYNFNSNANDQSNGYNPASVFGTPDYSSGEYVQLDSGEYFVLPNTLHAAFDTTESLEIRVRFKVEGFWKSTPAIDGFGEEARLIVTNKFEYNQSEGGFDIAVREWENRLWILTTIGDDIGGEGKLDFVAEVEPGTWYDFTMKFVFDEESPYIQYIVNGVLSRSFFSDPRVDFDSFLETINRKELVVGSTRDNTISLRDVMNPSMDLSIDYLEFYSPAPKGDPTAINGTLRALESYMNGTTDFTTAQLDSLQVVFVSNWDDDSYGPNESVIQSYIETYSNTLGFVFTQQFIAVSPESFEPLRFIQFQMQQWIHDNMYHPATVEQMAGVVFKEHERFPGSVSQSAERLAGATFTVDGDYQTDPGFYLNHQEYVRRPTGFFVPAGELVTITVPDAAIGQGLSVYVGAQRKNLQESWTQFRRFPRTSTTFELNTKTVTIANPFGGGIYLAIPDGTELGDLTFEVSGAVKAPYYCQKKGYENSLGEFMAEIEKGEVPYVDMEWDNFMTTISHGMANQMTDPDSVMTIWNEGFDAINLALGRPLQRFRSEYLIQDRQTHVQFTAAPAAYPMSVEVFAYPYQPAIKAPIDVGNGREWYNGPVSNTFNYIIYHEFGHLHNMPTLHHEQETNVHLPATVVYNQVMGESIDSAFVYALDQRLNLEQATYDWIFTSNFINGERIGPESPWNNPWDQLIYQSRGLVKLVDIAKMFGWEALGQINAYFYEYQKENPDWSPYELQDDQFIRAASEVMGFNMAPHFEFHGILPSDALVAELSSMPTSDVIKDRILHYRFQVPDNAEEFLTIFNEVLPKISRDRPDDPRWVGWKEIYDEEYAATVVSRIDTILSKYYELSEEDLNDEPVITGLADPLRTDLNTSITLSLADFLVTDRDHDYPDEHTLIVSGGDNYTLDGFTIVPTVDFLGTLSVPIQVSDGIEESKVYNAEINVGPILGTEPDNSIRVYPNPTGDGSIQLKGVPSGSTYSVRDTFGRLHARGTIINNHIKINSDSGLYFLEVITSDGRVVKRKVVKK